MNDKFIYLTDILDRYANMVDDGYRISIDQKCQIFDIMIELNKMKDVICTDEWINLAKDLIKDKLV